MQRPPADLTTPENPEGRIRLDVMVTDAAGKPVSGLTEKDFTLLDNNRPQKIVSFRAFDGAAVEPEPPVQVILLFDTVNNGFTELAYIRQGMDKFLKQNGGHLAHPVSLAVFTAKGVNLQTRPSTDGNALAQTLSQVSASVRPRGLDPRSLSILALDRIAKDEMDKPGRKLLVWSGIGWPTYLLQKQNITTTPSEERDQRSQFAEIVLLSTNLREARITVYGGYQNAAFFDRDFLKGVKKNTEVDQRNLTLDVLALQTGGRGELSTVNRDGDLIDQLNSYISDSAAFYTISFDPPQAQQPDEYHYLKVIIDKPGQTAHSNTGYYDEPDYSRRPEPRLTSSETHPDSSKMGLGVYVGKPVTVAQLEQILKELQGKPDLNIAQGLSGLELTERLNSAELLTLLSGLPGAKAKAALVALGDASAFLAIPPAEIPANPAPDLTEQRRIISLTVDYLGRTITKLPNFLVTRTTVRYEDTMQDLDESSRTAPGGQPWRMAGRSSATVVYRDGKEVVDTEARKGKKGNADEKGLVTKGTFGPILSAVIVDAAHSEMKWSHWERDADEPLAVFRFVVPKGKSHYSAAIGGLSGGDEGEAEDNKTGYHGEVAINPATGTIVRLAIEADPDPGLPILLANIMVEYGAVEIGGKTYTCPLKSVSLSRSRIVIVNPNKFGNVTTPGPAVTRRNDVQFGNYHVFRSESRILPD